MSHQVPTASSGNRGRNALLRWAIAVVALIGVILIVVGACSSKPGPPQPAASAAGTLNPPESDSPASSSGDASSAPASSVAATAGSSSDATSAAPSTTASSSPKVTSSRSVSSSPKASSSAAKPTTSASKPRATSVPPAPTDVVDQSDNALAIHGPVLSASEPVSLSIPAININSSPLLNLGQLPDGSIAVPPVEDPHGKAGWYNNSPTPGTLGPSVLLGHVDSAKYGPSIFYSIGSLKPGDEVSVTRKDGIVAVFKIDGVRSYSKVAFPTKEVYGNLNYAGLRLITCGGTFDPSSGHYQSNIIAFASLVSSHKA